MTICGTSCTKPWKYWEKIYEEQQRLDPSKTTTNGKIEISEELFAEKKFVKKSALQSRTKYLTKVEKFSKIGLEKKSLISAFAGFRTAIAKV